jgi:hypothetical protein
MAALHGKQDPMLEASRFGRLLRQAHDAEVADVRKVSDHEYEVVGRGIEPVPTAAVARPMAERVEPVPALPPTPMVTEAAGARGGVRFRRGSRVGAPPPVIPMIGVVSLDEEPAGEPGRAKGSRRRKPAKAPAADPTAGGKKKASTRTRKKAEG